MLNYIALFCLIFIGLLILAGIIWLFIWFVKLRVSMSFPFETLMGIDLTKIKFCNLKTPFNKLSFIQRRKISLLMIIIACIIVFIYELSQIKTNHQETIFLLYSIPIIFVITIVLYFKGPKKPINEDSKYSLIASSEFGEKMKKKKKFIFAIYIIVTILLLFSYLFAKNIYLKIFSSTYLVALISVAVIYAFVSLIYKKK